MLQTTCGVLPVEGVPRADDDELRAAAQRLGGAHRRLDAEAAGDVVRRRHDSAALWVAADDQRLRPQRGVFELLDGGVKGVEVDVSENRHGWNGTVPP